MASRYCPSCRNELLIEDKELGKKMLCPHCLQVFVPPFSHSGLGIVSFLIGVFVLVLELGILTYFLLNITWESETLTPLQMSRILKFVRLLGFIVSWSGIACAAVAYQQKRRQKTLAKWGLILNILPSVFLLGYVIIYPYLPKTIAPEKEEGSIHRCAQAMHRCANANTPCPSARSEGHGNGGKLILHTVKYDTWRAADVLAPSPLGGEGWGEGGNFAQAHPSTPSPSPLPQGERGEVSGSIKSRRVQYAY